MNKIDKEELAVLKIESAYKVALAHTIISLIFLIFGVVGLSVSIDKPSVLGVVSIIMSVCSGLSLFITMMDGNLQKIIRYHLAYELWKYEEMK